ncbi:MAG TPA: hypothetical protein VMX55_03160 [candidate division Zixibacteria bacterium]|nr:hypothetical protein [candidate division Zixibacteria bacterium]
MYDLIALRVNCPICDKSLADPNTLVDNIPGVKLNISFDESKGTIHLSSIYGSYNYTSNLKIPLGTIVNFSCPHCKTKIISNLKCEVCSALMVPLKIEDGGIVRICSRAGCKKHSVEFENLHHALEHFYSSFDYGDLIVKPKEEDSSKSITTIPSEDDEVEIIKSGSYLRAYCPHCDESLIEDHSVLLKVIAQSGEGVLILSPYLNVFTNKSTIDIVEGETVKDIKCPHCNTSLLIPKEKCKTCNSSIVGIQVAAVSKLIDFYFCSKKGCRWHGLSEEDIRDIILEDSREW